MRTTTLLLPDDLRRELRAAAAREGTSVGEFVRRVVRRALEGPGRGPERGRGRRGAARGLPESVEEFLALPAGSLARCARPGDAREPEDPYAGLD